MTEPKCDKCKDEGMSQSTMTLGHFVLIGSAPPWRSLGRGRYDP